MKILYTTIAAMVLIAAFLYYGFIATTVTQQQQGTISVNDGTGKALSATLDYKGRPVYRGIIQYMVDSASGFANKLCMLPESYRPVRFFVAQGMEDRASYNVYVTFEHKNIFGMVRKDERKYNFRNESDRVSLLKFGQ